MNCTIGVVIVAGLAIFTAHTICADQLATDQATFQSTAAVSARASGSPVGPPQKVTVCHNGHALSLPESAVAAHLAHGDTLGPCANTPPPTAGSKGNNGIGNGVDPQPPGNPPVNDGAGQTPGNSGK